MLGIGVVGLNSSCCSIDQREKITKAFELAFQKEVSYFEKISAVLLSTCHRVELYFFSKEFEREKFRILDLLTEELDFAFDDRIYMIRDQLVFFHLAKVTSGLASPVILESDIQRQVKLAYYHASNIFSLPEEMHYLFQKSLKIGKEIRSRYSAWKKEFVFEHLIYHKTIKNFLDIKEKKILFIGFSDINKKLFSYFHQKGLANCTLITRDFENIEIKKKYPFLILQSRESLSRWFEFDIIIAATKDLKSALTKKIGEKKVLFFDLSIPRTYIRAEKENGLILYNIEDLALVFEEKKRKMASEINEGQHVLNELIHRSVLFFDQRKKRKERYALSSLLHELTLI